VPSACVVADQATAYKVPTTKHWWHGEQEVPLFGVEGKPDVKHVRQGDLGNCYLMTALLSIVHRDPQFILDMMHPLDDGTVAVRLFRREGLTRTFTREWIRVDKRLIYQGGSPVFASVAGALWPLVSVLLKLPQRPRADPDHV
jgi:hypothetical protein